MRDYLTRDILAKRPSGVLSVSWTIFNILAVCVRGGAMMYYVTWILGTPEVFVAFLTTYCVGNLIGSTWQNQLTDWKCKVTYLWWTNALACAD